MGGESPKKLIVGSPASGDTVKFLAKLSRLSPSAELTRINPDAQIVKKKNSEQDKELCGSRPPESPPKPPADCANLVCKHKEKQA